MTDEKMNTEKLLIVEDDVYLRDEILRVLDRRTDYQVLSAESGEQALEIADKENFILLITDVRMPGIDGIELLSRLKESRPELASIIITAFADEKATIRALRLGANDYIRKPFSIRDLINAIDRQIAMIRLRNEARQSRRFTEELVRNISTGLLALDLDGVCTAANAQAIDLLQLPEDIIGKNLTGLLSSSDVEAAGELTSLIKRLATTQGHMLELETEIRQAGLPLTYRIVAIKLKSSDGSPLGVAVSFNDVSEIIQAQKLNAWKDLARTVAHEIKNPLTPIKLSAQQLLSAHESGIEVLEPQIRPALETIIGNVDRLDSLAREFSRFGRLPSDSKQSLELTPVLGELLDSYAGSYDGVSFSRDFQKPSPVILGDRESLIRLFTNLLNNSIEAMPDGGEVSVIVETVEERAVVLIRDSGQGMDEETRSNLFKPYVTSKKTGTGLGLVIAREIVNHHSGEISVQSRAGAGTSVKVTFPVSL